MRVNAKEYPHPTRRVQHIAAVALASVFVLSACSGGGEGDQIGIADGQSEDPVVIDVPIVYVKRPLPVDGGRGPASMDGGITRTRSPRFSRSTTRSPSSVSTRPRKFERSG